MSNNHWKPSSVGDLCTFSSGHGFGRADWAKAGLPIIRIQHLNGSEDFDYFAGTPEPDWIVEPGELLFAWAGTQGVSFGPKRWAGPRGVLNQHIYRVRPKPGIDPDWLHFLLQVVTIEIERKAHGFKSNLVHVRKADITGRACRVPMHREQRAIAASIKLWGRGVEQAERLLKLARRRKRGLMQQLLTGRRRFPEFAALPWREVRIGEVLQETSRPVQWDDNALYRLASVRRASRGLFWREALLGHQIKVKKLHTIRTGDFLLSHIQAAYGAMALVPPAFDQGHVSDMYTILTPKDPSAFEMAFFGYLAERAEMRHAAYVSSNGFFAERLRLNFDPEDFLRRKISIPPTKGEQQKIAAVLASADRQNALLEEQLDALQAQKKGLMQKLVTGEMRLPEFRAEGATV